ELEQAHCLHPVLHRGPRMLPATTRPPVGSSLAMFPWKHPASPPRRRIAGRIRHEKVARRSVFPSLYSCASRRGEVLGQREPIPVASVVCDKSRQRSVPRRHATISDQFRPPVVPCHSAYVGNVHVRSSAIKRDERPSQKCR